MLLLLKKYVSVEVSVAQAQKLWIYVELFFKPDPLPNVLKKQALTDKTPAEGELLTSHHNFVSRIMVTTPIFQITAHI